MANPLKDFNKTKYKGVYKSDSKYLFKGYKYFIRVKVLGKIYSKVLGYSIEDNLSDRSAFLFLNDFKNKLQQGYNLSSNTTLNILKDKYFDTIDDTEWNTRLKRSYDLYVKKEIGFMKVATIREANIQKIITTLKKKGLAPRTQKRILEILKPIFMFAKKNKMIIDNPCEFIRVKVSDQKKIVINSTQLFYELYQAIITVFKDDSFYQALFLFALLGRRKGEVLKLKWENIDLVNNFYVIEETKNKENQKYPLYPFIKTLILDISDNQSGLVFKSPTTGKQLTNIHNQLQKIKDYMDNSKITLHYMRNIYVSFLAEQGVNTITMSGILGHRSSKVIDKYLSLNYFKSSQEGLDVVSAFLGIEK